VKKKLIEVALPILAISEAMAKEKTIRRGHPWSLHLWWGRRPLTLARAIIFASLVDDPSSRPEKGQTAEAQKVERKRLFAILKKLTHWENLNDRTLLAEAQEEIKKSCGQKTPEFLDPFAGGGSFPLEAQRLGLKALAYDLNPVAVMINKALVEIPARFGGRPPVNHAAAQGSLSQENGENPATGLAADFAHYAEALVNRLQERLGHLYPTIKEDGQGKVKELTVAAWIWARTVKCPNPACGAEIPLARSFKLGKEGDLDVYVDPVVKDGKIAYEIKTGSLNDRGPLSRGVDRCVACNCPIGVRRVEEEGAKGALSAALMAIAAIDENGRRYFPPNESHRKAAAIERPSSAPDLELPKGSKSYGLIKYGLTSFADLFAARQLALLTEAQAGLDDLIVEIEKDAEKAGYGDDGLDFDSGGQEARAYSQALAVYLSFLIDKAADWHSTLITWNHSREQIRRAFARPALAMTWDYAEGNPFAWTSGGLRNLVESMAKAIKELPAKGEGLAKLADAQTDKLEREALIFTDPPYYDYVKYAELADYYYAWLRPSLKNRFKTIFRTIRSPKGDEMVYDLGRAGGDKLKALEDYEGRLKKAYANLYAYASSDFPVAVHCPISRGAIREDPKREGTWLVGWEIALMGLIEAGFTVAAIWPLTLEAFRPRLNLSLVSQAGSVILVVAKRPKIAEPVTLRDFLGVLKAEMGQAMDLLADEADLGPGDLALAGLGPGLGVYSRYARVLEPDGSALAFPKALALVKSEMARWTKE
jgi:putative DNA methylase